MHEDLWDRSPGSIHHPLLPKVIINMVSSLDGKAAVSGKAGSLGGETDRRLMRILRSRSDAIMIGAGTLRAEKISFQIPDDLAHARASRGLSEQPLHIILSNKSVPELKNVVGLLPNNVILVVNEKARETRRSFPEVRDVIRSPNDPRGGVDLHKAIETLREEHGVDLLLVEGGPSLNGSLLSRGLTDELYLTLAPKIIGADGDSPATIVSGASSPNQKLSHGLSSIYTSYEDSEGDLLLRYNVNRFPSETRLVSDK